MLIMRNTFYIRFGFLLIGFTSCQENQVDQIQENGLTDSTEIIIPPINYESEEQLAKFNTDTMSVADSMSYFSEIMKIQTDRAINYSMLDSLFEEGLNVDDTIYYHGSKGIGFGFTFNLKGGFSKSAKGMSLQETTAIKIALEAYEVAVIFKTGPNKVGTQPSFDLIHFLLSRGVDPNTQGVEPLYNCIKKIARDFEAEKYIQNLLDVYNFYGFDIKNLDLSACDEQEEILDYLIGEGARTYNMNTFRFAFSVHLVYDQRVELDNQGVIFDFSEVDGNTFAFETDTSRLQMMLEMGLSPDHITKEGVLLRDDFRDHLADIFIAILDRFVEERPHAQ